MNDILNCQNRSLSTVVPLFFYKTASKLLVILFVMAAFLFFQNEVFAAVAHDAASESHTGIAGSINQASFTWTHTPIGTPRGVLVYVYTISATQKVTGVTYGGVAMTAVAGGAAVDTLTEPGRVDTFFLGASVPTGARSVVVTRTNDATVMYASAATQTAATNTEVTGIILLNDNQALAQQSVNDGSTGSNSVRYAGAYSGLAAPPTVGANSTLLHNIDLGSFGTSTVRETTAGQGARLVGFTAASDDVAAVHLAVRESPAAPTVATNAASALTATGATLNGTVSSNRAITTVTFDYGTTIAYGSSATATPNPLTANAVNAAVSAAVTGLTCNTLYHFRVVATNSAGTTNGSDLTFTTTACVPTATTNAATLVAATTATLNGTVSSNGASTAVTFEYGLTAGYGSTGTATPSPVAAVSGSPNSTAVSLAVSSLTCNTLYHFRVVATNSVGTTNGSDATFTTATTGCVPTATTDAATSVTATGATLNGTVSSNGISTTVTFEYGLTAGYGSTGTATPSPVAAVSGSPNSTAVSLVVSSLTCNTLYHYRVVATNTAGTTNGGDLTFTTSACPPAVVINTYYPGTASVAAGATSITLGVATGDTTPIAIGDLLLIMQMQDATIDSTNTATYGTVSAANGGLYEYAIAASAVPLGGGSLSLLPCGTINAYTNAAYVAGSSGQRRFQVIRVPVYASYTINAITALAWNGSTGGVLAFDVTGALNLNTATVDVSGKGFRGGGGRILAGGTGTSADYLTLAATNNANGSKGEGIAGTPRYLNNAGSLLDTAVEGYPSGSYAKGAPANAGGGATDDNPPANNKNTGGGGGANGGGGGMGGYGWSAPASPGRGIGGAAVSSSAGQLALGGGGGAASTNDGTGTPAAGFASSGAAGGGIVMVRAGSLSGTGAINVSGANANNTVLNDGSGGGGAAGSVMVSASSGLTGLTVTANGGIGGTNTGGGSLHGPGGGGGGGYAITSAALAACNVNGGANGTTFSSSAYGATPGSAGSCPMTLTAAQIPGTRLGATSCGPDHYELSVPASSITCLPTTVTVTACADNSNPCGDVATRVTGTASLATTGGTIVTPATFTTGVATTTLSDPLAVDGTAVTVSLTSASIAAQNAATCRGGAGGCTTTFNTAGFIFSSSVGGGVATIPTQVAGTSSGTYYLRAVKTLDNSSHTCGAAFSGAQSVNFAYECNDPTTCYTSDLMSVNGGTATTIARNNNGGHASTTPVNMTFDGNGNAPFTFIYSDVGQVTLWANKTVNSAVLTGSTNPFVVKPGGFVLSNIVRTSDSFANPAAADAAGAKFVKAGEAFSATVTAVTSTGSTAYNYGKEISPEGVKLTKALVPGLGLTNNLALANPTAFAAFTNGVATGSTFNWPEVGIITLTPSVGDGDYLGVGDVTGTTTGNIGRFYPDHFTLSAGSITTRSDVSPACSPASIFTYMNEPFQAGFTLMAKGPSPGNATLLNYVTSATPANNFSKLATATPIPAGFGFAYLDGTTDLSTRIDSSLGISGNWTAGELAATATLAFTRDTAPDGHYGAVKVGIAPVDSDGVALSVLDMDVTAPVGNEHAEVWQTQIRFGRLWLGNAYGSDKFDLVIPFESQYWNGSAFVKNTDDGCTALASGNIALGNQQGGLATYTGPIAVDNGAGKITLTKPSSAAAGSVDLVANLGSSGSPSNCPSLPYGTSTSAALSYLSGKWCGLNYDRDPTARATFGIYGSSLKKGPIYIRESY